MADKFLVIDGSSLIHRAFFALPPLMTKQGLHTGAVYGLCNMLLKLLGDLQPAYMAVAFDKSRKTFRTELYADYKGQRKPTPSELSEQFPLAMKVLDTMGIPTLELDNYEADDIIGTFAVHAPEDVEVIIVTGDRDELQLVDTRTKVYYTKRGISDIQIFDEAEFAANYEGLVPKQLIELKGLMGDASDNIPGVPGVGPKTALKLIKEYGDVETVLENIDKVSGKALKAKLADNKESALLSKKLATICTEAPVDTDIAKYALVPLREEARTLLQDLEFRNMYDRFASVLGGAQHSFDLFGETVEQESTPTEHVTLPAQAAQLFAALKACREAVPVAVTVSGQLPELYFSRAELLVEGKVYILDSFSSCWDKFDAWLADADCKKLTVDSKELYKCCLCRKVQAQGIVDDVALAAYLADPGHNSYALTDLSKRYLASTLPTDCENIAMLAVQLREQLKEYEQLALYEELELPLAPVLAKMELSGITPDMELLAQLNEDMTARIAQLEKQAMEQAGEEFNLKSPKQLGIILFERLQLPVIKKTKTGYSTDAKVLEALEGKHPLIATILEHRKLAKLQSTYLDGLKPLVNAKTGRIHTHFQQTVTVTGRLSSTDPNLQNIPTRTEEGKQIRRIFVPGAGYDYLMSCDYSQVELRILACIAQDELLLDAFRHGQDIHARTAAEVFGVPLAEVTHEMRSRAKAVNFGIVYGISDFGLAKQLDVGRKEAAGYIESYFARYTGVKKYMEDIVAKAREQGYVSTLMGRRRYLPDIRHSNFNLRSFAERTAINTPIQGTAADIMKKAMIDVERALEQAGCKSRILLQVHDELVLEVKEDERERVAELMRETMQAAASLEIPLFADVNFGKNWAETK
ncbi:DNA polymerase I [uncultured Phascolarctobacterium sp.]|mgnify:FL=1|jgi:DNA polymerase-1|uniref:DNA polymerase I n=1 Tax=uncultured Phascolarctobacterium sp. TaxID=512296 RepID=UPI0025F561EB|nr:DNA polymerase I [uncultured Phascolarctobacterium sp.]